MNIMAYIAALILMWNAMLAAGWTYNPYTATWTPPAHVERKVVAREQRK